MFTLIAVALVVLMLALATAVQQIADPFSLPAAADLSSYQYCLVKMNGSGAVTYCTAATDEAIGVLQNKPDAAGQACEICGVGPTKIKVGAAVTEQTRGSADSTGRGVTQSTANDPAPLLFLEGASAANQIVAALFQPGATLQA